MLETVKNAFRIKDIRKKLFFTLLMLVVIRLGSQLPVPGTDRGYFAQWFAKQNGDFSGFLNAFTGGSFENMSLFALNITPYITSSIIMQLLTIAIPKLEEMQKDGEDGRIFLQRPLRQLCQQRPRSEQGTPSAFLLDVPFQRPPQPEGRSLLPVAV